MVFVLQISSKQLHSFFEVIALLMFWWQFRVVLLCSERKQIKYTDVDLNRRTFSFIENDFHSISCWFSSHKKCLLTPYKFYLYSLFFSAIRQTFSRESSCSSEGGSKRLSETVARNRALFENNGSASATPNSTTQQKWPGKLSTSQHTNTPIAI